MKNRVFGVRVNSNNYKCNHIPYVANKKPRCVFSFQKIVMSLPLLPRKKRGAKKHATKALVYQPNENRSPVKSIIIGSPIKASNPKKRKEMQPGRDSLDHQAKKKK